MVKIEINPDNFGQKFEIPTVVSPKLFETFLVVIPNHVISKLHK